MKLLLELELLEIYDDLPAAIEVDSMKEWLDKGCLVVFS